MKEVYDKKLKARMTMDEAGRVRSISHSQEFMASEQEDPIDVAVSYLSNVAGVLGVQESEMSNPRAHVDFFSPAETGVQYRLSEVKQHFGTTTVSFYQTCLNIPVWRAGVSVTIKNKPNRVVGALNTSQEAPAATLPASEVIERYRGLFSLDERSGLPRTFNTEEGGAMAAEFVRGLIDLKRLRRSQGDFEAAGSLGDAARLIRGRFFVYCYDADKRLPKKKAARKNPDEGGSEPVLPLKSVPPKIQDGKYYVVAEVTFTFDTTEYGHLNWLALVELESGATIYLRALVGSVNGQIFRRDPITQSGDATMTPDRSNAVLNPFRSWVPLPRLGPANGAGNQALTGAFAQVSNVEFSKYCVSHTPSGDWV